LPRVLMGWGMGFVIIPLTTMTMSSIRREEMGNAAGIFNLLRNLGGSFGVAFVTTMLARRAQFHQAHLMEHLTPFDPALRSALPRVSRILGERGLAPSLLNRGSLGAIQNEIFRQASMMSFNDAFYLLSIMMMLTIPLVLLMKAGKTDAPPSGVH
jgi:MFS transporter, DHA2 family, multidrug resistance protein